MTAQTKGAGYVIPPLFVVIQCNGRVIRFYRG